MILAARQLGWAHSVPDNQDGKRGEKTRLEIVESNGGCITMPPQRCPYLLDWLCQAGPAQSGAMALTGLSAAELQAWSTATATALLPWEFRALQRASRAYCSEQSSPGDFPPFGTTDTLADDDVVAENLARGLDKLL